MSKNRLLMMMAGLAPTPYDRALAREKRRAARANRIGQDQLRLMEMIARRERGEDGAKPMPFANVSRETNDQTSGS